MFYARKSTECFRVSVCIVTWNEESRIRRCLESVVGAPGLRTSFEIIIVDNASTDGTVAITQGFARESQGLNLQLISMGCNHLGKARAEAVRQSRANLVAFIDADCVAPPGWLDGMVSAMEKFRNADRRTAAVGSGNIPPVDASLPFYQALETMFSSFLGSLGSVQAQPRKFAEPLAHLPTCNIIYDRAFVLAAGNFCPQFAYVCEDLELSLRLGSAGYLMHYVPGLEVTHFHRPSLLSWAEKMFRYGAGQIQVASHYPRHLLGVKILPLFSLSVLLGTALYSLTLAALLVAAYGFFLVANSYWLIVRGPAPRLSILRLIVLFFTTHFCYALGEAYGCFWLIFNFITPGAFVRNWRRAALGWPLWLSLLLFSCATVGNVHPASADLPFQLQSNYAHLVSDNLIRWQEHLAVPASESEHRIAQYSATIDDLMTPQIDPYSGQNTLPEMCWKKIYRARKNSRQALI